MTAADKILQKALVGSGLDSRGWSQIQAGLRDRAFFSSQVENVRILDAMRRNVTELVGSQKSPSEIRRDLREYLYSIGYDAGENRGTIKDLMTKTRLDVMMKTNADQAKGYVTHLRATTPGAILAFPAYELVRVQQRKMPRDWSARWKKAGAAVGWEGVAASSERMIALKTSPIWAELSVFGNPFPPFDFNSGMGLKDVKKSVCREIGLLKEDEQPEIPKTPDFNANLSASIDVRDDSLCASILRDRFGDQVDFSGNKVHFRGELIKDLLSGKVKKVSLGTGYNGEKTSFSSSIFSDHASKHFKDNESHGNNVPMEEGDYELLPTLWRSPDRHSVDEKRKAETFELDIVDGNVLTMIYRKGHGPVTVYKKAARSTVERMHASPHDGASTTV